MKKNVIVASIFALALCSCDKKQEEKSLEETITKEATPLEDINNEVSNEVAPPIQEKPLAFSPIQRQEKMIAKAQEKPLTTLAINENHFDFKEVKKGETVSHRFELTNTGDKPLIISAVKPGCGCTAPEYSAEPILPGEKGFVTLKFNSERFQGIQRKSAEVYANVEHLPVVLTFSANVITKEENK